MDVYKAIRELQQEKHRLDVLIASLESGMKGGRARGDRRGRKSMSPAERKAVSERMAAYWAARRAARATGEQPPADDAAGDAVSAR